MKRTFFLICILVFWGLSVFLTAKDVRVRGFDKSFFDYQVTSREKSQGFDILRITYPSMWADKTHAQAKLGVAYYYLPHDIPAGEKRPALVCLHILGGDGSISRTVSSFFASHGLPTIRIIMPWFRERAPANKWGVDAQQFCDLMQQTPDDVRRGIDILTTFPEVDLKRIGLVGISMGSIFGTAIVGQDDRIERAAFVLGGGGIRELLRLPQKETRTIVKLLKDASPEKREKAYKVLDEMDPLNYAEKLQARAAAGKIVMYNAEKDELVIPSSSLALAKAMHLPDAQHHWFAGLGHYSAIAQLPNMLGDLGVFFGVDEKKSPKVAKQPVLKLMLSSIAELLKFGPGMMLDLDFEAWKEAEKTTSGKIIYRKGSDKKLYFNLAVTYPKLPVQKLLLGENASPWLASEKVVFYGKKEPGAVEEHYSLPSYKLFQMLPLISGMFNIAASNPEILKQYADISLEKEGEEGEYIKGVVHNKQKISFEIYPDAAKKRPGLVVVHLKKTEIKVVVHQWEVMQNISEKLFAPPENLPRQDVAVTELVDMFRNSIEFLLETM